MGSVRQLPRRGWLAGMRGDGRVPQMGPGRGLTPRTQLVEADGGDAELGEGWNDTPPPSNPVSVRSWERG